MQIVFNGLTLDLGFAKYSNGRTAITMTDSEDGAPCGKASVNVEADLTDDQIAIKNYNENEGILSVLVEAGIVSEPFGVIESGFVQIPVCNLLVKPSV